MDNLNPSSSSRAGKSQIENLHAEGGTMSSREFRRPQNDLLNAALAGKSFGVQINSPATNALLAQNSRETVGDGDLAGVNESISAPKKTADAGNLGILEKASSPNQISLQQLSLDAHGTQAVKSSAPEPAILLAGAVQAHENTFVFQVAMGNHTRPVKRKFKFYGAGNHITVRSPGPKLPPMPILCPLQLGPWAARQTTLESSNLFLSASSATSPSLSGNTQRRWRFDTYPPKSQVLTEDGQLMLKRQKPVPSDEPLE